MDEYDDGLDMANIAAAQDLSRQHFQRGCAPPACMFRLPAPAEIRTLGGGDVTRRPRGAPGTGCASGRAGAPRVGVVYHRMSLMEQPGTIRVCACFVCEQEQPGPEGAASGNCFGTAPSHGWGMDPHPTHS